MEAADFFVEDLLDLSNGGDDVMADAFMDCGGGNSTESSAFTTADSCHSSLSPSFPDHFSGDLCDPYRDFADLEWLSNFVEESFSSDDLHKFHHPIPSMGHQPIQPAQTRQPDPITTNHPPSVVPAKARSKRSRVAPCDWSTRLLMVPTSPTTSSSDPNPNPAQTQKRCPKKRDMPSNLTVGPEGSRRCLHCAAEKTPQWRTGPMGPKTLCNACGVRYKSGRLVPEYRPASSPSFVSAQHSNSHRKVMELRRQKEIQEQQLQQVQLMGHHAGHVHGMLMGVSSSSSSNGRDDNYLLHHHHLGGPDYHHMI